jgi:manganese/zinc/iron transport system permease protein
VARTVDPRTAHTGFDLARGSFLGIFQVNDFLSLLDWTIGLDGYTTWNTSISASMVLMLFVLFVVAWVLSPQYGLVSGLIRRRDQSRRFRDQVVLGHIYNHQGKPEAVTELAVNTLYQHFKWSQGQMRLVLAGLHTLNLVRVRGEHVTLTERG